MTASIHTGLAKADRTGVAEGLTKVLADSYAVYLKTHVSRYCCSSRVWMPMNCGPRTFQ